MIETQSALTPEELNDKIVESLRTTGVVNSSLDMIKQLDQDLTGKSQVVPVELKVDGTVSAYRSKTLQEDQLQMVSQYVSQKVKGEVKFPLDKPLAKCYTIIRKNKGGHLNETPCD
mgnify:CR=1 FL=1